MQPDFLIVGYGDIARRVAPLLTAAGRSVALIGRHIDLAAGTLPLQTVLQADLDAPASLAKLPFSTARILYLAPPPQTGEGDLRVRNFCAEMSRHLPVRPEKIVYVSTSGVYGDCEGALVDETRPVNPQSDRARRRVDAENILQRWGESSQVPIVILRVAGIYGPGRLPLQRLRDGVPILEPQQAPFSNRIHSEDLALICRKALEQIDVQGVFNICDGEQSRMSDYFIAVARQFGLPEPTRINLSEARQQFSAEMLSYLNESRRLDNRRMLKELDVALRYPTLEAGLLAIQQQGKKDD